MSWACASAARRTRSSAARTRRAAVSSPRAPSAFPSERTRRCSSAVRTAGTRTPTLFYRAGGGPLLDLAPYYLTAIVSLLGPIASVAGFAETPTAERLLGAGPRAGETIVVEVPTHSATVLQLRSGALATLTVSFEARDQYESRLVVYGSEGVLELPDANHFGGEIVLRRGNEAAAKIDYEDRGAQETRGYGIEEMVTALRAGRPHRASAALGLHVLEAAEAALASAEELRTVTLATDIPAFA